MSFVIINTVHNSSHQVRCHGTVERWAAVAGSIARSGFHRENDGGSLSGARLISIFISEEGEGLLKKSRCRFLEIEVH